MNILLVDDHAVVRQGYASLLRALLPAIEVREAASGDGKIGTTGRGIGPAYEDKIARRAIQLIDLFNTKVLEQKLEVLLEYHNFLLEHYHKEEPVFSKNDF